MNIAILIYPGVTALDVVGPYEVLNAVPDARIQFVWKEKGPVVSDGGVLAIGATHTFDSVKAADVVIVPGSWADTLTMMSDVTVLTWLKEIHRTTRYTASVSSGALILAAAGLLKGIPATTHWAALPVLSTFGVEAVSDERVVESDRIITCAGVTAGIDMALRLVANLCGEKLAKTAQLLIEYDPQPPFDAGNANLADTQITEAARTELLRRSANVRNLLSIPRLLADQWLASIAQR